MKKTELRNIIKEEIKSVLNENEMAMSTLILIPALAGVLGLGVGSLIGQAYIEDKSLVQLVKDWWKSKKDNEAMTKIADRLKDDPEVQSFIKNPNSISLSTLGCCIILSAL